MKLLKNPQFLLFCCEAFSDLANQFVQRSMTMNQNVIPTSSKFFPEEDDLDLIGPEMFGPAGPCDVLATSIEQIAYCYISNKKQKTAQVKTSQTGREREQVIQLIEKHLLSDPDAAKNPETIRSYAELLRSAHVGEAYL